MLHSMSARTRSLKLLMIVRRSVFWSGVFGASAVAALVALCCFVLYNGRLSAERNADRSALNIAQSVEIDLARNFELFDLILQGAITAYNDPAVAPLTGRARHFALFDNAVHAKYLNSVALLDEAGNIVEDSASLNKRQGNFADREYFKVHAASASAGLFMSKPLRNRLMNGEWIVAVSRRIDKPDGSFGGVAVAAIQLSFFESMLAHLELGPRGNVSLVQRDGTLIGRQPSLPEVGRDFSGSNLFRHYPASTSGLYEAESRTDQITKRFTYREIPGLPLVVVVGLAHDDIYAAWRSEASAILALIAVMAVAMAGLGILLTRERLRRRRVDDELRKSEARYRLLAEHSSDAIVLRTVTGERIYASPSLYRMIGRSEEEFGGASILEYAGDDARKSIARTLDRLRAGETHVTTGFEYPKPDGSRLWLETVSNGVLDDSGVLTEIVTNVRDATRRKLAEDELTAAAATDALTGLGNRRAYEGRMLLEWKRAARTGNDLCVLMIDADYFKTFNDRFGHLAGDAALREIGNAIQASLRRPGDFGARYGGEEFIAILPETDASGGMVVAEAIRASVFVAAVSYPSNSAGDVLTVSIGIAVTRPSVGKAWDTLVARADAALYLAKKLGRNRSVVDSFEAEKLLA